MQSRPTKLNPTQQSAADHGLGPALVVAGPGTGKTTTLVGRFLSLIEAGVEPSRILATTFTRLAALQIKERVVAATGLPPRQIRVGTFHSVCFQLIKQFELHPNAMSREFVAQDMDIRKALKTMDVEWDEMEALMDSFSRFKDSMITPLQAIDKIDHKDKLSEYPYIAQMYGKYQEWLERHDRVDFGDLLNVCISAMRDDESLRSRIAGQFDHIMIDEYQDVNPAQVAFTDQLLFNHQNLWAVGDDDQAIYGWRGGRVEYMTEFGARYPDTSSIQLDTNYRSHSAIIDPSSTLISNNQDRLDKVFKSSFADPGASPTFQSSSSEQFEAIDICDRIESFIKSGVAPKDIAILIRNGFQAPVFESELMKRDIPFELRGSSPFWNLLEVRNLLQAVSILSEPKSQSASGQRPLPVFLYNKMTSYLERSRRLKFADGVVVLASGIEAAGPKGLNDEARAQRSLNISQAAKVAADFATPDEFLAFVESTRKVRSNAQKSTGEDKVVLSTIHQAKGLEWDNVFVPGLEDGVLPNQKAEDHEEERRLVYVAMTRTKGALFLSHAKQRNGKPSTPSPFLDEMEGRVPARAAYQATAKTYKPSPPTPSKTMMGEELESLVEALEDDDPRKRRRAIRAIGKSGHPDAIRHLTTGLSDSIAEVRTSAMYRIQELCPDKPRDAELIEKIQSQLENESSEVSRTAFKVLSQWGLN